VNIAFYARPADRRDGWKTFGELIQRLFALTITATLVMALVNVSMDSGAGSAAIPATPAGSPSCHGDG